VKTPEEWAALNIVTETNLPHEMPYIAWVLRYRVASPRFPNTMKEVVLQKRQFSAWNPWTHGKFKGKFPQEEIWHEMWKTLDQTTREKLYPVALMCATFIIGGTGPSSLAEAKVGTMTTVYAPAPSWQAPFGPEVCWYYSPISMIPAGTAPSWAVKARRTFTPSGIDPARFVFCERVE